MRLSRTACLTPLMRLRKLQAARKFDEGLLRTRGTIVSSMPNDRYNSFADFYPFYLSEHRTPACRRLHFVGTATVIGLFATGILLTEWWLLALTPLAGYGFAWLGHFLFEHNKPATFAHPLYSLIADFVMFRDILVGRIKF
jgi:hypothetical protein